MLTPKPTPLNDSDKSYCMWTGMVGLFLGLASLIQHMQLIYNFTINYVLALFIVIAMIGFLLLVLKNEVSVWVLLASAVLLLVLNFIYAIDANFSFLRFIYFIYTLVITVVSLMNNLPRKLRLNTKYKRLDDYYWRDKL